MQNPVKRIMVYMDGNEESITACEYGICLASFSKAQLWAIYVVNTKALTDLVRYRIFLEIEQNEYKQDLESDAERYLNHAKNLGRQKGMVVDTIKTSGDVQQEVKNKIKEFKIDLLVIGELPSIRSRRDETYNEAERLMRSVSCPVLIVKNENFVDEIFNG